MEVFIKNKNVKLTKKEMSETKIGNFYSSDRYYTLLNEYIDSNLKRKSRILYIIIKYLFKSSNYKHETEIANGKTLWITLVDIFCVLSFITFVILLIVTLGFSLVKSLTSIKGIANELQNLFSFAQGGQASIMIIIAIILGIIGIAWLIMYFKIRKKNAKLSLVDYVTKKIDTCLKLRFLIKSSDKIVSTAKTTINKKGKNEYKVYCLDNFEQQGAASARWLNIQVINLLSSIFTDFNLVFRFINISDDEYKELQKIVDYDFKNIDLVTK